MLTKILSVALLLTLSTTLKAQVVDCNIFLKGNYAEAAINELGAFGSTINPPAGYHARAALTTPYTFYNSCLTTRNSASNPLGFVADPHHTNWTTYYGDYYIPGTPAEGWIIEVNGRQAMAATPLLQGLTAADTNFTDISYNYSVSGGIITAIWEGTYDSVKITQITTLDTSALAYDLSVKLTNLSAFPKDSVYYVRYIDPDNEQTTTSNFITSNRIKHQMPGDSDSIVMVAAAGTRDSMNLLALKAKDHRATAFILDYGLAPTSLPHEIWNRTTTFYYDSSVYVMDVGIGIVFNIGHLAGVDSAADSVGWKSAARHPANTNSFAYTYSFDSKALAQELYHLSVENALYQSNKLTIHPNPSQGNFSVGGLIEGDAISILDMTGAVVNAKISLGDKSAIVNELPKGQYIVVIAGSDGVVRSRLRAVSW